MHGTSFGLVIYNLVKVGDKNMGSKITELEEIFLYGWYLMRCSPHTNNQYESRIFTTKFLFIYFDLLEKIDFCNMYESLLLVTLHTAKRS